MSTKPHSNRLFHTLALVVSVLLPAAAQAANTSSTSTEQHGWQQVIHTDGTTLSGLLITSKREPLTGPVNAIHLFSLNTETCGIVDFEASLTGLTCLNCSDNAAVLPDCQIPRTNRGWQRVAGHR